MDEQEVPWEYYPHVANYAAARAFVEALPRLTLRCRWLPQVSPFAESWTQLEAGPIEQIDSPAEAMRRLHATLMRNVEGFALNR